jgi:prepilin-type N-terminal cleavage/methylation domain-containing protein
MRLRSKSGRSGFTLVEIVICAVIISMILGAITMFDASNRRTLERCAVSGTAQEQAHRALERVLHELVGASISRFVPDPTGPLGSNEIVFERSNGVTATGAVVWSSRTRIALVMDTGETLNGLDDDRNGLVDERMLTVTYDHGTLSAATHVIAHRLPAQFPDEPANGVDDNGNGVVDENGFNVQRVGNLLNVRLAVQVRGAGGWVSWSENSVLRVRN